MYFLDFHAVATDRCSHSSLMCKQLLLRWPLCRSWSRPPRQHVITSKHTQKGLALLSRGFLASTGYRTSCAFCTYDYHRRHTSKATKRHQLRWRRVTKTTAADSLTVPHQPPTDESGADSLGRITAEEKERRNSARSHIHALSTSVDSKSFLFASLSHQWHKVSAPEPRRRRAHNSVATVGECVHV